MDPKGYEKKPWFPYLKNMYDEIGDNMMNVDAKGYEEKPWWPYVLDLQEKIKEGGGGGSSDFSTAQVNLNVTYSPADAPALVSYCFEDLPGGNDVTCLMVENSKYYQSGDVQLSRGQETASLTILMKENAEGSLVFSTNSIKASVTVDSVSGNIIFDEGADYYIVTGNGTINLTLTDTSNE